MFKRMLIALAILMMAAGVVVAQDDAPGLAQGMAYVLAQQNADGGFSNGWTPDSDFGTTADVVVALAALAQTDQEAFPAPTSDPLVFISEQVAAAETLGAGVLSKVITAAVAAGADPRAFAGHDLVSELLAAQDEAGLFGMGMFEHCLALIALQNSGEDVPEGALEAVLGSQNEDGGWGFMAGERSDTNTTGLCLQALALTEQAEAIAAGLDYLAAIQNEDGGWPYQNPSDYGTDSDANSTALVLQALIALEQDLAAWNTPQVWLAGLQNPSGAFAYQVAFPDDNFLATVAALPALAGVPLNAWAMMAAVVP